MWRPSDRPRLALITCGGKFNRKLDSYPDNLVVYATQAWRPPAHQGHGRRVVLRGHARP